MHDHDEDVTELIDRIGTPAVDEIRPVVVGASGGTIVARVLEWSCGCWATKATPKYVRYVSEPLLFLSCSFNHSRASRSPETNGISVSKDTDTYESIVTSGDFPLFV